MIYTVYSPINIYIYNNYRLCYPLGTKFLIIGYYIHKVKIKTKKSFKNIQKRHISIEKIPVLKYSIKLKI